VFTVPARSELCTLSLHDALPIFGGLRILRCSSRPFDMADLKLIALDEEDLAVLSAHLQDAVVRVGDILYEAPVKRFAMVVNRFRSEERRVGKECRSWWSRERGNE